jgi:uncharacterized membrane protein YbhN (UPF0104 family)
MMRKQAVNLLKIGVTILGLYLVLREVDLASILAVLRGVNVWWVFVTFMLVNASLVLRAYRWLLLLRGVGAMVPFGRLVELYFVGNFFNMFLLSGFGGDVVRVLESARDVPGSVAAGTVILDRFTGLIMLFVMALLALPWRPDNFPAWLVWFIVVGWWRGTAGLVDARALAAPSGRLAARSSFAGGQRPHRQTAASGGGLRLAGGGRRVGRLAVV